MPHLPTDPFTDPDYTDRFELVTRDPIRSIDAFVTDLVLRQPSWLTALSMGLGRRSRRRTALDDVRAGRADALGKWAVLERSDRHIVFGEDMRIMRYRLTFRSTDASSMTAETEVEQSTRWFGPLYWALAAPLHRRFVPMMLRNAAGGGSTVHDVTDGFRSNRAALG